MKISWLNAYRYPRMFVASDEMLIGYFLDVIFEEKAEDEDAKIAMLFFRQDLNFFAAKSRYIEDPTETERLIFERMSRLPFFLNPPQMRIGTSPAQVDLLGGLGEEAVVTIEQPRNLCSHSINLDIRNRYLVFGSQGDRRTLTIVCMSPASMVSAAMKHKRGTYSHSITVTKTTIGIVELRILDPVIHRYWFAALRSMSL